MEAGTRFFWLLITALLGAATYFGLNAESRRRAVQTSQTTLESGAIVQLQRVVDGDTLLVDAAGQTVVIRLLGIKSFPVQPERDPVSRFGKGAVDELRRLTENQPLRVLLHRSAGADHVTMIRLADLGAGQRPNLVDFPGGQLPPAVAKVDAAADAVIPAPQSGAVIVVNPADKLIYHYEEGMAAPMGSYKTYGRTPKAALVVDRSLRETGPGVFSIKTQVPAAGSYDVAFFLDSPRVVHCFNLTVRDNPALKKLAAKAVTVQPLVVSRTVRAGEPVELKFKLTDPATGNAHENLSDVRILAFLAPGVWQKREIASAGGDGIYSLTAALPEPGIYYVFVESPSLGLRLNAQRPFILQALGAEARKESL